MFMSAQDILSEDSGIRACLVREVDQIRDLVETAHPGCMVDVKVARIDGAFTAIAHGVMPTRLSMSPEQFVDVDWEDPETFERLLAFLDADPTTRGFVDVAEGSTEMQAVTRLHARVLERVCPERTERKTMESVPAKLPRKTVRVGDV